MNWWSYDAGSSSTSWNKKKWISEGFEYAIKALGGNPEDVKDIPFKKIREYKGQEPFPGKPISMISEVVNAKKQAIMSYVYEIQYKSVKDIQDMQKESQMVLLKEVAVDM